MTILLRLLLRLLPALANILGRYLPFLAVWVAATRARALADKNKTQDGYIKARERMDDAEITPDADTAREWLRKRDPKQR
jgi:hypothetical protein